MGIVSIDFLLFLIFYSFIQHHLLLLSGTRAPVTEYLECNLGTVRSNAVVTRGGYDYNETEVVTFINLLQYAQQHYGRDSDDDWK